MSASTTTQTLQERRIVIIGGGIIGCTSAYYLAHHPAFASSEIHVTLLEASTIAAGASGKAGGLVAKWAYPSELTSVSFEEHEKLAEKHNGRERWGWREVMCGEWEGRAGGEEADKEGGKGGTSIRANVRRKAKGSGLPDNLDWIDEGLTEAYEAIAGPGETAQVHPYEFTMEIIKLATQAAGHKLEVIEGAKVISIEKKVLQNGQGERVAGVTYTLRGSHAVHIPADVVLLAAGPWSPTLLPSLPIRTARSHSIVIEPATPVSPYVLFTSITNSNNIAVGQPEIYSRPFNRVYACGPGDDEPIPDLAADVKVSPAAITSLRSNVSSLSAALREGKVEVEQACYLPNGGPIVGNVDAVRGLIVATGHTVWGICNAPGTAKAVSELIMDGSLNKKWKLGKLAPKYFL
ncbi:hypothetical protein M422DRAFT_32261 [Sphaerobolus stellatus SS14]|uniref:FAD dependent oxidoreductase domain-containing protein n=1 Tax=Sphaerobolus stellatus (strain SS14) TaxID=990650 RepID=A0A0C9VR73_SPHS4|nr:hypothetical protein M422DRAFT_32261 [Sphaerobolus stellatus SS14]